MQTEQKYQRCFTFDQFDELETALCTVEDTVHKAATIHREVLNTYLLTPVLDYNHPSQSIRDNTAVACFKYNTWRTMLECVLDILERTRGALKDVNAIIYETE